MDFSWLQLFAEGEGDAGSAPAETAPAEATTTGVEGAPQDTMSAEAETFMSRIPERAKETFKNAYKKTHKNAPVEVAPQEVTEEPQRVPLADLLKDEAYKAEYQEMMNKAFQSRFKKYDGLEERANKMSKTLETVAQKYGLDPNSETFLDNLGQRVSEDNSYWEEEAMKHNQTPEEYRQTVELRNRAREAEARAEAMEREEASRRFNQNLMNQAAATQKLYPDFNLNVLIQDETFRSLLAGFKGDTTAAYESMFRKELQEKAVAEATNKAKKAVTNSIASGQNRPIESGLSNNPASVVSTAPSFKGMNSAQMREWYFNHKR